jgi:hypothetical protein
MTPSPDAAFTMFKLVATSRYLVAFNPPRAEFVSEARGEFLRHAGEHDVSKPRWYHFACEGGPPGYILSGSEEGEFRRTLPAGVAPEEVVTIACNPHPDELRLRLRTLVEHLEGPPTPQSEPSPLRQTLAQIELQFDPSHELALRRELTDAGMACVGAPETFPAVVQTFIARWEASRGVALNGAECGAFLLVQALCEDQVNRAPFGPDDPRRKIWLTKLFFPLLSPPFLSTDELAGRCAIGQLRAGLSQRVQDVAIQLMRQAGQGLNEAKSYRPPEVTLRGSSPGSTPIAETLAWLEPFYWRLFSIVPHYWAAKIAFDVIVSEEGRVELDVDLCKSHANQAEEALIRVVYSLANGMLSIDGNGLWDHCVNIHRAQAQGGDWAVRKLITRYLEKLHFYPRWMKEFLQEAAMPAPAPVD